MGISKEVRRIEMQRLIKAYLLFKGEATSKELAVFLDHNFGYHHSLTTDDVARMLSKNRPVWLDLDYVKESTNTAGKWRLK